MPLSRGWNRLLGNWPLIPRTTRLDRVIFRGGGTRLKGLPIWNEFSELRQSL